MERTCATIIIQEDHRGTRFEETNPTLIADADEDHQHAEAAFITIVLAEPKLGHVNVCTGSNRANSIRIPESAARRSFFFSALLDSGMLESQSRLVELKNLDPRATASVVKILMNKQQAVEEILLHGFLETDSSEMMLQLQEAFDYLQVSEGDAIMQPLLALHGPEGIGIECARRKWIISSEGDFRVIEIPSSKKTRHYRFWVCLALCMKLLPRPNTCLDQAAFTTMLEPFAGDVGSVALRRELIEYGLVSRKGDCSSYWRPIFTVEQLGKWLRGAPRKMV